MPQAKKSTRSRSPSTRRSSRTPTFKEPAAIKRLTKSLDAAANALGDLRKDVGRDAGVATRDLQKQLRTTLTGSRRDIGKLVRALQRDFDSAQTKLAQSGKRSTTRARSTRSRSSSSRSSSSRSGSSSTRSRSTRSGAGRARSSRST